VLFLIKLARPLGVNFMKYQRSWLCWGIISGFLFGFFCFAYGVFTHSHNKTQRVYSKSHSKHGQAGTTL